MYLLRKFLLGMLLIALPFFTLADASFSNRYYSPRNRERPIRKSTSLIVLHTTEAPSRSALQKLSSRGECHYCIDERGQVYRIIDHRREAFHAGRSMWRGRTNVDAFSVGIEVCGYHNRPLAAAQYRALANLIAELQYIYKIKDHNVVTHSQVAYGTPNKWFRRNHRGRKRCGMSFALPSIRKKLHLDARSSYDPDVRAGRLIVGDPYLAKVLYGRVIEKKPPVIKAAKAKPTKPKAAAKSDKTKVAKTVAPKAKPVTPPPAAPLSKPEEEIDIVAKNTGSNVIAPGMTAWDIAQGAYNHKSTIYTLPDGTTRAGNKITNFKGLPAGTKVSVAQNDDEHPDTYHIVGINGSALDIAGEEALSFSTLYIYPDGHFFRGSQLSKQSLEKLKYGTKILIGYDVGGPVTSKLTPFDICGAKWNAEDSFYVIHGQLVPGTKIDEKSLPAGTRIFYKN